jgi:hypothetical protein
MGILMSTEPGFSWIPPSELERRIDTIPLPKKLKLSFTTKVTRWQSSSGSEWTVDRLKSFKDYLLHSYAIGEHSHAHKPEWFSTTPSGKLSGVMGSLARISLTSAVHLKAVLFLVNIYTACSRTEVPASLLSEIKTEIQKKPVQLTYHGKGIHFKELSLRTALSRIPFPRQLCGKPVPLTAQLPGKVGHAEKISEDIIDLAGTPLYTGTNKELIDEALGSEITIFSAKFSTVVGTVGISCEPGNKLRYYAAPNQLVQRALEPLKSALQRVLEHMPWDCTKDQRKADGAISAALLASQTVHSVDMSKATDNFPWEFQKYVLKSVLKHRRPRNDKLRHLMDFVVTKGYWKFPGETRVKWGRGQPLGLGPSFPLFALSHGLLLLLLNNSKWDHMFYILGDDVVILDDDLARKYREILSAWDVKVSDTKSFTSSNIAQFGGKTYTKDGSFWIPKWVPFTRDNLIDMEAWWYSGLTKGLPDHDLINRVLCMPFPYGIGRNPKGLPLASRFTTQFVVEMLDRQQRRLEEGRPSTTRIDTPALIDAQSGLDQGSKYALESMLMSGGEVLHPNGSISGDNQPPTGGSLGMFHVLMHGTETPRYPYILRKDDKVDRFTLGTLRAWKQIFRRVDSVKLSE